MKLFIILTFIALAFAQDDAVDDEVAPDTSVRATVQWPQNDDVNGGALVEFPYSDVGDGTCNIVLPTMVSFFHVTNAHIVPGDESNPVEGRYQITAQGDWEALNGTVTAVLIYDRDSFFNISEIDFTCDPLNEAELSVLSFPQNQLVKEASSNVYYAPGFHVGDVLTITFPQPVARFNFTTMHDEYEVESDGSTTFSLSGFQNEVGVDDMKEVHFSLDYEPSTTGDTWFSAADVTVSVSTIPDAEGGA